MEERDLNGALKEGGPTCARRARGTPRKNATDRFAHEQ
jgi:hypothetical protein